jgi:hypothetical protein
MLFIHSSSVLTAGKITKRNMTIKDASKVTHWLPRPAFMELLAAALAEDPVAAKEVKVRGWGHGEGQRGSWGGGEGKVLGTTTDLRQCMLTQKKGNCRCMEAVLSMQLTLA